MIAFIAITSIAIFFVALHLSGVIRTGMGVTSTLQASLATLRDKDMDDLQREKAMQSASLQLMGSFLSILLRCLLCLLAAYAPLWGADAAGLAPSEDVMGFLSRLDVILLSTVFFVLAYIIKARLWPSR